MIQTRLITALFDTRDQAERAIERLVEAGIPRGEISLLEGESSTAPGASAMASTTYEDTGFWASLSRLFMPDEDRYAYAEGLRRGGYVVSLNVADARYDRALDILDDEGTVNVDERAESWRAEGWKAPMLGGSTTGVSSMGATSMGTSTMGTSSMGASSTGSVGMNRTADTARNVAGRATDEVIPIVEESLRVGKRETQHGRVRVRSYVVETPVQETVNLREERVHIERRPVDRPLQGTETAFRDRTIEATERVEEAVVSKEARVVEEVALRKDSDTRRQTVSDTVRKTKVEVEDERVPSTKPAPGRVGGKPV